MKHGRLIILSGPSGVGKGTIREQLFKNEDLDIVYSISLTTRLPRPGEENGKDYYFVDKETFLEKIANDEFIEWAEFVGNYYGTSKKIVEQQLQLGHNVLLEIEIQGATQVLSKVPEALSIFISPPSIEELEKRIRGRQTEKEEVIFKRLEKARYEMQFVGNYKYNVVNDDLDRVTQDVLDIIKKESM